MNEKKLCIHSGKICQQVKKRRDFFIPNGWPASIGDSFKPPSSLIQISRQAPKQPLNDDAATLFVIHFS